MSRNVCCRDADRPCDACRERARLAARARRERMRAGIPPKRIANCSLCGGLMPPLNHNYLTCPAEPTRS